MKRTVKIALSLSLFLGLSVVAAAANNMEDSFAVKQVAGDHAVVEGKPKDLKVGDYLYFVRSPFRFKVTAINGNQVTVELPAKHDLADSNVLLRNATPVIKKNIDTEVRLKRALEE